MADNRVGELRRSAVVMTYAPGAIVDMRSGKAPVSGVSAGLEEWDKSAPLQGNLRYQKIIERRLCKKLGKRYFRLSPVLDEAATLPNGDLDPSCLVLRRFPEWLQCPSCDTLRPAGRWARDPGHAYRYCATCSARRLGNDKVFVMPVRFAVACIAGHLEDFPWNWWVNHKSDCRTRDTLTLAAEGPGLGGLTLRCPHCKQQRSLDGIFRKRALAGLKCRGSRPWLRSDDASCECTGDAGTYRTVQRGASNLHYPVIESALDIPPWTRTLERVLGDYWDYLAEIPNRADRVLAIRINPHLTRVIERERISADDLAQRFEEMLSGVDSLNTADLRIDEYRVFTGAVEEKDDEFEVHREEVPHDFQSHIARVVRVARLREVRVVTGFTRINPPFDGDGVHVAPLSNGTLEWLPALEVRGEGLFLQFDADALHRWETQQSVIAQAALVATSWGADWNRRNPGKPIPFEATPRLLMIHSFAHALIRQLTLECGYSTASLRERLYVSDGSSGMAGILVYTATSDSDGTLGGLQRRAGTDLLGPTLTGALKAIQWCSSDPLCISGLTTSSESHSVAACHSCMLVPETSCELHNRFLDRALLVGSEDNPELGFFNRLLVE